MKLKFGGPAGARAGQARVGSKTAVFAANTSWNLVNFRGNIIKALIKEHYHVVAIAPRDAHTEQLRSMGVQFYEVDFRSAGTSPLDDLWLLIRYLRLLRSVRPVVFLGFTIKPNIYGSIAARLLGIATINNVSGLGTAFIKKGPITLIVTQLYRLAFRRSATVFFQNSEDRRQFIAASIVKPSQAAVLPGSGVDLARFVRTPTAIGRPFTFLLIARLLWDKGAQEYVEAAAIVKRKYPESLFRILGFTDVDNRTAVPRSLLESWISQGLVQHCGATDDVRPHIAAADCVVLPSYREGLPRSLLEASAMERPIIGTDVPGVRDVVDHGVTGLLCAVRNAGSLAAAMIEMIEMPEHTRNVMGRAGREKVERSFSLSEVTSLYLEAVQRVARG